MPGYEPFLLCDFHVHTRWSDGTLTVREVVDLYGSTRKFDVIAITDHILMKRDLLARVGRIATLGRRAFGIREELFGAYLADIRAEAKRAFDKYGLLVIPGAEITQNRLNGKKNSHVIALDIQQYISADQRADEILREIRRQDAISIACHPHHRTTRPEALSLCRQQRLSQAETPVFVEDAAQVGEELAGDQDGAAQERRHRAHVVSQGRLGGLRGDYFLEAA